ncbi:MAG TPA: AAA family ATPase [Candidatus Bathyarchaeia archaeon]|nr:AAA family ATPase [Candidatus Bathyarchaeia archaeon]
MTITGTTPPINESQAARLRVGVLCIGVDPEALQGLDTAVTQVTGAHLVDNVDRRIVSREVTRLLEKFLYKICIIDFDEGVEASCRTAEQLRDNCDGGVELFAASSDSGAETIMAAMRSGFSEFLTKPFDPDQVAAAVEHVTAKRRVKGDNTGNGRVVTLTGAKGGVGVTSLALHLALTLVTRHQQQCLLVDQHPALGDVSLYLGLKRHHYSFYELVHNTDRLDKELLQGFVLTHASGLQILDSREVIDRFPHPSPEAIEHTLSFLAVNYDSVVIDCPPGMTEDSCAALRQSDQVVIVITPELPAIRNAVRTIEFLAGMHYPDQAIEVVLNRHEKTNVLTEEEIETALRRPIAVKIPNSYEEIVQAINSGTPSSACRNAKLALAFEQWADRLMGAEPEPAVKNTRPARWFERLGL